MFLGHVDYRPDVAITYGSMFERSHADGIIVIGDIEGGDDALEVLAGLHRNVVGVTDRTGRRQVPGATSDSEIGVALAMDHLWSAGHRRIVCVSDARTEDGRFRMDAYERFMVEHGLGQMTRMYVCDQEPDAALALGRRVFAEGLELPSAIFATSDTTAIGLMQAAYQAGLVIPDQLSFVGYDDIDIAPFTIPPLTTISQHGVAMGEAVADLVIDMIEQALDREQVADVILEPHLVLRASTRAVPEPVEG
jgi:LacI family transcriptional regulator